MDPIPAPSPAQAILDDIREIVRALRVSSRSAEKNCGLSAAQLFVLRAIQEGGPISVNELAERTLTHQSSVSVVAQKLVRQKYVLCAPSKSDRRRKEMTLSKLGQSKLRRAPQLVQERLIQAVAETAEADRAVLAKLLRSVVDRAGLRQGKPPLFFEETEK